MILGTSEQENAWLAEATACAVADARRMLRGAARELTDQQLGFAVSAAIFSWISCRYRQAVAAGLDKEKHVARMDRSPADAAIVRSILGRLADGAAIDWSKPLASWSKDEMASFIEQALVLIDQQRAAIGSGSGVLLAKREGVMDDFIPF